MLAADRAGLEGWGKWVNSPESSWLTPVGRGGEEAGRVEEEEEEEVGGRFLSESLGRRGLRLLGW